MILSLTKSFWLYDMPALEGMSRTAIRDLFGRNRSSERIGAALQLLATKGTRLVPKLIQTVVAR